ELEAFAQLLLREGFVADDVDLADLGALALADPDLEPHLIAGSFLDRRIDAHAVLALAEVHVGEALRQAIEHGAIEGLAGGEAHVAQGLLQVLGLDVLVARDLEALDGRALEHDDNELRTVAPKLHIAEE